MPTPIRISRRSLLRGAGGAVLALPFLEAMDMPRAFGQSTGGATSSPKRFVVMFAGMSTGRDNVDLLKPMGTGAAWVSNTALAPIESRGVRPHVGIVSNLNIPLTGAGHRPPEFHASTVGPLLSGVTAVDRNPMPRGPTADQIVASRFAERYTEAERARLQTSVAWRVQAESYRGGEGPKGLMSARREAGTGRILPVSPVASPSVIYSNVFGGMTGPDPAAAMRAANQRRSVLDFVATRAQSVMGRLGSADRARLQRHFDEVRALERAAGVPMGTAAACMSPTNPGMDPVTARMTAEGGVDVGYTDERRRADLLGQMLYLALTCDLTRSASLMLTYAQCFMNAAALLPGGLPNGVVLDVHEVGHTGGSAPIRDAMQRCMAWHIDVFAQLVARLASVRDGAGTLLDQTAVVLVFEGGMGHDPEGGANGVTHSSENMCALYAGGGLRGGGQHVDGGGAHPARVLLSAMRAVGVSDPLGEITDPLPALVG